ncbi:zf-TFIIB domain-containing protein [Novosphingobium sp. JCM 18896]|uniref:TFIIB-type zinc ribbon-containing protein n=1 Tax=Novosphingobium sp. JCM 18896 TaxID=2989731 RepID=UPI0022232853|nr:zf-TFIIB domain-containing protein [Novosphingobium sp. JCM 18896]MCW1432447.1 zf-TFIIB domain-containing protein [Novosphingobium sp. JCM 18896]
MSSVSSENQGLPCPVCRIDLVMSERQGVEIDHCPRCRGVWLDRGELDKIIERSAAQFEQQRSPFSRADSTSRGEASHGGHDDRGHGHSRSGHRRKSFWSELFD